MTVSIKLVEIAAPRWRIPRQQAGHDAKLLANQNFRKDARRSAMREQDAQEKKQPDLRPHYWRYHPSIVLGVELLFLTIAMCWIDASHRRWEFQELPSLAVAVWGVVLGIKFGASAWIMLGVTLGLAPWGREMGRVVLLRLGGLTYRDAAVIAVAAGIGEEFLFRGALQASLGLAASSLLFGACHWDRDPRLRAHPSISALVGAGLGLLYQSAGTILAPIAAHVVYDLLALVEAIRMNQRRCSAAARLGVPAEPREPLSCQANDKGPAQE